MRIGSVFFLAGICYILQFTRLPELHYLILNIFIIILFRNMVIARLALWFLGGYIWTIYYSNNVLEQRLLPELESAEIKLTGKVISLPDYTHNITRFNFKVKSSQDTAGNAVPISEKIRLSWYLPKLVINSGDSLQLIVRLKQPHGYFNPGVFDYESWLFRENIGATGYVVALTQLDKSKEAISSFDEYRQSIRNKLNEYQYSYPNSSRLVSALLIGDRSGLLERHTQLLYETDTAHLIAISGLHIGLIAAFGYLISKFAWSLTIIGMNFCPSRVVASMLSMLCASWYAALSGFSLPTQGHY